MTIPRGGIVYGCPLEGLPITQEVQVRRYVTGLSVAIISEANVVSFPNMIPFIRSEFPDCKIGLEVSSWGGWTAPSAYWPLRSAFGQEAERNNWWLRRTNGGTISTHPNFQLVDLTKQDAFLWYTAAVNAFKDRHEPDFLFWDECHRTLGFLPLPSTIPIVDATWSMTMARVLRRCGGGMVNGTILTAAAPLMIRGRYIQNAVGNLAGSMAMAREHLAIQPADLLVFEHPVPSPSEVVQVQLNGLVATFGGCCQMNIGGAFREPIPGTRLMPEDGSV